MNFVECVFEAFWAGSVFDESRDSGGVQSLRPRISGTRSEPINFFGEENL